VAVRDYKFDHAEWPKGVRVNLWGDEIKEEDGK
jgi:hypothetical protein